MDNTFIFVNMIDISKDKILLLETKMENFIITNLFVIKYLNDNQEEKFDNIEKALFSYKKTN